MSRRLFLLSLAAFAPGEVGAAPQGAVVAAAAAGAADEIVVTARRRAEDLQDVPLAVSAVGAAQIEATGTFNIARLTQLQPSVQFISSNPRNSAINIRGIGAPFGLTNDGIEQGVGLYIDQVYYARIAAATLDFVDIEQVEVLRGPQGTLYGKNTTAGAVNIRTRKPSFETELRAEASYGNLDYVQAKASVSGPLVADRLAARLSASFTRRDGTLFNTVTQRRVNEQDNIGVRGQLLWQAGDNFDVTLSGDYNKQSPEGFTQLYAKVVPTARASARQFGNLARLSNYAPASTNPADRLVDNDSPLRAEQLIAGVSLLANWDVGAATLTSISAWRKWDWKPSNDRDFTALPITTVSANPSQQQQWSQELRLASNGSNRFDYVVGAFYFHQKIDTQGVQVQGSAASLWLLGPTNGANPALLDGLRSDNDIRYSNDSAALYGKLTWNIGETLSVAPGLRLNYDRKRGVYDAVVSGGLTPATPAQQALKNGVLQSQSYASTFSDWNLSGDITLSWKPRDGLLGYVTYARSFKSGGINLSGLPTRADGVTPALETANVAPEKVDHYEAGLKTRWLDGTATLNIAAFRTDIRDFQATVVNGSVGVIRGYLANVPKVRSQGIEADLTVRPVEAFNAYVSFALTDAKYVSFPGAPVPVELSGGAVQFVDASGGRMPGVSRYALSYGAEYRWPVDAGELYLGVDGSFRSDFSSSPTPSAVQNVEGHALTNLRGGWRAKSGWELFGWVRNAFDVNYFEFLTAAPASTGLIVGQPGDPRTWGATVKLRF
ncbi:TonB-dependent receptor [Sandaracinobacteroides saxicola]|uniref:TonB-dependent receptor n=1 Tax=Sandaracinobacteroides saxicola TaxID=2759707 RepID=A0A7G5IGY1_9SPHN|nr:TonB-dependent receptor [Sandaracinobacteroides saxicola]QMW22623.1 TonB-dependent receptor [Sandaracinobacteroides saxicola]